MKKNSIVNKQIVFKSSVSSQTWNCHVLGFKNPCGKSLTSRKCSCGTNLNLKLQTWRQRTGRVISWGSREMTQTFNLKVSIIKIIRRSVERDLSFKMSYLMATDFTTMLSRDLLGHGPMHSSLVWNVSPEHGFPSGVGVGLVQALVLLTMDPPHGFSQRDHWLHSVKPPSTETTLCWWVITKFFSQCTIAKSKRHRQSNQPIRTCRAEKRVQISNNWFCLVTCDWMKKQRVF